MRWILRLFQNLRSRDRLEHELNDELSGALEWLIAEKQKAGLTGAAARRAARLELGSTESIKDAVRDVRAGSVLESVMHDIRYGVRLLVRNPLFTVTAVCSLGVGIGATTTIFGIAEALLFRPPYGVSEPDRLVDIGSARDGFRIGTVSYQNYVDIRQRASTLQDVYAYSVWPTPMSLGRPDGVERIHGHLVTANYFAVLSASPASGRFFDVSDGSRVVVLSYRLWTSRFERDRSVVGRLIRLNGQPFTVVGIVAEGFQGTTIRSPDLWLPIDDRVPAGGAGAGTSLLLGGRLKPGVSRAQAAAELETLAVVLERESPEENRGLKLRVATLSPSPDMRGPLAIFLLLLSAIVLIVLAVACTNLTSILLARTASRRREFAMRMAIGAGRSRIVRQLMVETLVLFTLGCGAGLLLSLWFTAFLLQLLPALPVPLDMSLALDARGFVFAAGVSLVAAVLSALLPARQAAKADLVSAMREDTQTIGRMRLRNAFVVAQVAFSIILIVVAGLFGRALNRVASIDPGFNPAELEVVDLDLTTGGYTGANGPPFARDLLARIATLPGVARATLAFAAPGAFEGLGVSIAVDAAEAAGGRRSFDGAGNIVAPGYFATLGIPFLAGRDFTASDRRGAQGVAIVSETTARRLWPGKDPSSAIGQFVLRGTGTEATASLLVVGVAGDVTYNSLVDGSREIFVYLPLEQNYLPRLTIVARANSGRSVRPSIAAALAGLDPNLPILDTARLADRLRAAHTPQRIVVSLAGSLGLLGLLLSAIGIHGVSAYAVAARTREIGVRLALGARRSHVVTLVLKQSVTVVAIGGVLGLALAAGAGQVLRALLFGIPPLDPVAFGGAAMVLTGVGFVACYAPLRRAMRIRIVDAVRWE